MVGLLGPASRADTSRSLSTRTKTNPQATDMLPSINGRKIFPKVRKSRAPDSSEASFNSVETWSADGSVMIVACGVNRAR
jgi:hypothetical protein